MASIAGPVPQRTSQPSAKHQATTSRPNPTGQDPFHGHERMARLAARFVAHLFACPDQPAPAAGQQAPARLDHFIAYALHRTRLPESVTFASLFLLQRLKARFPAAKGSSGHRLFISAFMLASKIICDDTYSNKSWCIVAQGMFALREINQMEREMCSYLEWQLNVDKDVLEDFTVRVRSDFSGPGPYPALVIPTESSSSANDGSNLAAFGQSGIYTPAPATESPRGPEVDMLSSSPPTPGASSSASVSPASIAAPRTPTDSVPNYHVEVAGEPEVRRPSRSYSKPEPERTMPTTQDPYLAAEEAGDRANAIVGVPGSKKHMPSPTMRSKLQVGRDMFAYATRTIW